MRFFLLTILVSFFPAIIWGQTNQIYIGAITVKGAKPYSYKIEFSDSSSYINGYSITDLEGKDQTKTKITGFFNQKTKRFDFKETKLLSTKSKINRDSFCYIHAELSMKEKKGNKFLTGTFVGFRPDRKTICGQGNMTLFCRNDLVQQFQKMGPKADTLMKILHQLESNETNAKNENPIPLKTNLVLQAGDTQSLFCPAAKALIEIWDNGKIDGDKVTIQHNGTIIASQLLLTDKKYQINIALTPKKRERLVFNAVHEGAEPPMTAKMTCTCGDITYTIDASAYLGLPVELIIYNQ